MGDARVLYFAAIDEDVRPTAATRHSFATVTGDELLAGPPIGSFHALAVAQYEGDDAYYLLYLDTELQEVTDTWHRSVGDAKEQAEFEYEGISTKWVSPE